MGKQNEITQSPQPPPFYSNNFLSTFPSLFSSTPSNIHTTGKTLRFFVSLFFFVIFPYNATHTQNTTLHLPSPFLHSFFLPFMAGGKYLKELNDAHLEGVLQSAQSVHIKVLEENVQVGAGSAVPGTINAGNNRVVATITSGANGPTAIVHANTMATASALKGAGTPSRGMVCFAVLTPFTEMPLHNKQNTPLSLAPFTLYQVPETQLETFLKKPSSPLMGYRVHATHADSKTQYGVVDILPTIATADPKRILADGLPFTNGEPGGLWSLPVAVFHDLPFKVDVYVYPGHNDRIFFGEVESGNDTIRPFGSLLISTAAKKVQEAKKLGRRIELEPSNATQDSFLAGVLCSRVVLDRGCAESDTNKPGAWEIVNNVDLVGQLCFSLCMSKMISRLDRGESPSPGFINLMGDERKDLKRQRTSSTSPPPISQGRRPKSPPRRK